MRLQSSGIPAHRYGHAYESWTDLVLDQQWDITIPIISEEDQADDQQALRRDVDPTEFLVTTAREKRPLGMALNGVPFFSPLTTTGTSTTVSHTKQARVESTTVQYGGVQWLQPTPSHRCVCCEVVAHMVSSPLSLGLKLGEGECSFIWDVQWDCMVMPWGCWNPPPTPLQPLLLVWRLPAKCFLVK